MGKKTVTKVDTINGLDIYMEIGGEELSEEEIAMETKATITKKDGGISRLRLEDKED